MQDRLLCGSGRLGQFTSNEVHGCLGVVEVAGSLLCVDTERDWILKSKVHSTLVQDFLTLPECVSLGHGAPGEIRKNHDSFSVPSEFFFPLG